MKTNTEKKYAIFTIDVERFKDTECVAKSGYIPDDDMLDGLDTYMNILQKHNIKATMFTLNSVAKNHQDKIKHYVSMGHKLALHGGKTHRPSNELSDKDFETEIKLVKSEMEDIYGVDVVGFRAPFFGIEKTKLDILRKLGFKYDSSRLGFSGARYNEHIDMSDYENLLGEVYKKKNFFEFGLPHNKIFGCNFPVSGGGYLRLTSWSILRSAINDYIKKHNYYVFYLHPFELSNKKIPLIKGLKLYDKFYLKCGHLLMPFKIEKIIKMLKKEGYTFTTFEQLAESH